MDFAPIEAMQVKGRWDDARQALADGQAGLGEDAADGDFVVASEP